jgi:transposase InsO family protein
MPSKPGELCAVDFYGPLPIGRGGVRFIFVCVDVFSKFVRLYPLRSATTKACLNRFSNDYIVNVTQPKCVLSDNGTQFVSRTWKRRLADLNIRVMFSPIRHPQPNPSERYMREIGKFCWIDCREAHKKWPELLPHIERWLKGTISDSTG